MTSTAASPGGVYLVPSLKAPIILAFSIQSPSASLPAWPLLTPVVGGRLPASVALSASDQVIRTCLSDSSS